VEGGAVASVPATISKLRSVRGSEANREVCTPPLPGGHKASSSLTNSRLWKDKTGQKQPHSIRLLQKQAPVGFWNDSGGRGCGRGHDGIRAN
jgi:hypothetical protein